MTLAERVKWVEENGGRLVGFDVAEDVYEAMKKTLPITEPTSPLFGMSLDVLVVRAMPRDCYYATDADLTLVFFGMRGWGPAKTAFRGNVFQELADAIPMRGAA